ncbi:hypothetical protein ACQP1W_52455 (plasmid) [Spirillospora sp. CA-255316]
MIPAGREPIDATQAARLHGMALKTARDKKLFDRPTFPPALTRGQRKRVYDAEQVTAHAKGEPVPAIPQAPEHPMDLLEREEAAELWGVTPQTWDYYMANGYTPAASRVVGKREFWYRQTLQEHPRPGRGVGGGRPEGARDRAPRSYGAKAERLAQVGQVLDEAAPDATTAQLVARIRETTRVSESRAYQLLREARSVRR